MSTKKSTVFYEQQIDICRRHLNPEQFGRLIYALFDDAAQVDDDIIIFYEFMSLQKRLDSEKYQKMVERNRANGKLGGRPKKDEKNPQEPSGFLGNHNDNDNDNDNDKDKESGFIKNPGDPSSLISYLNQKTGGSFRLTDGVADKIGELLVRGHSYDDMVRVIDAKAAEWSGSDKMRAYLRPSTLFGDHFEEYAQAPVPFQVEEETKRRETVAALKKRKTEAEERLADIREAMREIEATPEGIRGHWNRYGALADDKILIEQEIRTLSEKIGG